MLTLFAIPKPFIGHIGIIQRNALTSWTRLRPRCEIILFGSDAGTADVAKEFGACHVPEIASNERGTPLLNDMFEKAQRRASHRLLCFVNADIILMSDFLRAVDRVRPWHESFLMIGRRRDIGIAESWDFALPDWEARLRRLVLDEGRLRGEHAIDYFIFPQGFYARVPPFAIGRPCYDSWLIHAAISRRCPIIDATGALIATHQNHNHSHFGIHGEEYSLQQALELDECKRNYDLLGGEFYRFGTDDASHVLAEAGEFKRKYIFWRAQIVKRQLRRKLQHELLERTRTLRHRLGLRQANFHRIKRPVAPGGVKPDGNFK